MKILIALRKKLTQKTTLNVLWVLSGKLLFVALTLGWNTLIARNWGQETYGEFSFFLALLLLLTIPAGAGIPNYIIREGTKTLEKGGSLKPIVKTSLKFVSFAVLIVFVFLWLLENFTGGPITSDRIAFVVVFLLFIGLIRVSSGVFRVHGRFYDSIFPEQVYIPLFFVIFIGIYLGSGLQNEDAKNADSLVRIYTSCALVVFFLFCFNKLLNLFRISSEKNIVDRKQDWKVQTNILLSFSFIAGARSVSNTVDVLVIGSFGSPEQVALYKSALNIALICTVIMNVLATAFAPLIAKCIASSDFSKAQRIARKSIVVCLVFAGLFTVSLWLVGQDLIVFIYGPDYASSFSTLLILSFGYLVSSAYGVVAVLLNMSGNQKSTLRVLTESIVVNLLLSTLAFYLDGIRGVAIGTVVSITWWNVRMNHYLKKNVGIDSSVGEVFCYYGKRKIQGSDL